MQLSLKFIESGTQVPLYLPLTVSFHSDASSHFQTAKLYKKSHTLLVFLISNKAIVLFYVLQYLIILTGSLFNRNSAIIIL